MALTSALKQDMGLLSRYFRVSIRKTRTAK